MEESQKLKPFNWGVVVIIFLVMLPFFIFLRNILNYETKIIVFGMVLLLFSLINFIIWIKFRNLLSHILIWICLVMALSYFFDYKGIFFIIPYVVLAVIYLVFLVSDSIYRSNYKKILEIAARTINEKENGFTNRPFPVGRAKYSTDELSGFARFLKKHKIAFPFLEEKGIMLGINDYTKFWFGRPISQKDSYVSFDLQGNVTVNIAKKEYRKYRDKLSFDRLCESLGELFKTFLEKYQKGEEQKILDRLR